jgi:DNA-binding transcriptional regulator YhcF (GntR family)/DNA-binding XRE family transcriptional regulator
MPGGFAEYNAQLAKRISDARKAAGKSQKQLADLMGVNSQRISKIERGGVRVDSYFIVLIARALGVDPGPLVDPEYVRTSYGGSAREQTVDGGERCANCGNVAPRPGDEGGTLPRVTESDQERSLLLYREVAETLRSEIANGVYRAGHQLPSTRVLAGAYGVSVISVANGVKLLAEAGIVCTVPLQGTFVERGGVAKAGEVSFAGAVPRKSRRTRPQ